ncbi:hypothetical protein EV182_007143, partial [Spiromyces aspiralis]
MASSQPQFSSQESAGGRSTGSNRGIPEAKVTGSKVEASSNDWLESIRENLLLVDKSYILPEVVDNKGPILLTRPRRFGKTMCVSMFEDFFGIPRGETLEDKRARYRKLEIGADPEFIKEHCGRYPDVLSPDVEGFHEDLSDVLKRLLRRFPEINEDVRKKVEKEEADKKAKKVVEKVVGKKDDEEVDEKTKKEADKKAKKEANKKAKAAERIRLLSDLKREL